MGNLIYGGQQVANKTTIYASIQTKACTVLKSNQNLVKPSLKVVQDPENPKLYYLKFNYYALFPIFITVFYCTTEIIEESTQLNKSFVSLKEASNKPICYKCNSGENVEFPSKVSCFDTEMFTHNELTESKNNYYPLILKIEDSQETKKSNIYYFYATFVVSKGVYEVKLLKQKLEYDYKVYEISDIYGIDQSVVNAAISEKECTVCCTEKNDTILLPCKHMCLCKECSEAVKKDSRKCPICRHEIELCLTIDLKKGVPRKKIIAAEDPLKIPDEHKSVEAPNSRAMELKQNFLINVG